MGDFSTKHLPEDRTSVAPDGSDVRTLLSLKGGSMAHFELASGQTSRAVVHRSVEEIWFFLGGRGEIWRKQGDREEISQVEAGVCISLPHGTSFQFRSFGPEPLTAIGVTMPPWPGNGEAYQVQGRWISTISEKN